MLKPQTILFPVDLAKPCKSLATRALLMAADVKAKLVVVYVNDPTAGFRTPSFSTKDVEEKFRAAVDNAELFAAVECTFLAGKAPVGKTVAKLALQEKADLILVGHKARNRFLTAVINYPHEQIVERAKIPVLVVPEN